MQNWMTEMVSKLKEVKCEAKSAITMKDRQTALAQRRLEKLNDLKISVGELKDNLAKESQKHAALKNFAYPNGYQT